MKKIILLLAFAIISVSCDGSSGCSYNGHTLQVGDKGGCYYTNSVGNKVYVDKGKCKGCY
ncbi:hypothetical protein EG347_02040 [Chryseobacterium sp. G0186]|nr:hypothetical protein EG347_02040 [Chryseobacterium sp. G0186]